MLSRSPCFKGYHFARHDWRATLNQPIKLNPQILSRLQNNLQVRFAATNANERRKQFQQALGRKKPSLKPRSVNLSSSLRSRLEQTTSATPKAKVTANAPKSLPDLKQALPQALNAGERGEAQWGDWQDVTSYDDLPESLQRQMEEQDPNDDFVIDGGRAPEGLSRITPTERLMLKKFFIDLEKGQKHPALLKKHIYKRLQAFVNDPKLMGLLNKNAWNHLWNIEKTEMPKPERLFLAEVMQTYQLEMSEAHELMYLEALFWYGQHEKAVKIWEERIEKSDQNPDEEPPSLNFFNLGVRMFATMQYPERAALIGQMALEKLGKINAMTLMPAIVGSLEKAENTDHPVRKKQLIELANQVYTFAALVKVPLKERQYLRLVTSYVEAGDLAMAVRVHKDRLKKYGSSLESSRHLYDAKLFRAITKKRRNSIITIDALKLLPKNKLDAVVFDNMIIHYVERGDLNTVMKLKSEMYAAGVRMDIVMYNRLLKGFVLESGRKTKMDRLGCAMMESALLRQHGEISSILRADLDVLIGRTNPSIRASNAFPRLKADNVSSESLFDSFLQEKHPVADQATFSIMLQNYIRLDKSEKVAAILRLQHACGIPIGTYQMNHFLWGFLRNGHFGLAWDTFEHLSTKQDPPVPPDSETFRILWHAARLRRVRPKRAKGQFTAARHIFNYMISLELNSPLYRQENPELILKPSRQLYNDIIRTFGIFGDTLGIYLVIQAAAKVWGIQPGKLAIHRFVLTLGKHHAKRAYGADPMNRYKHDSLVMDIQWKAQKCFGDWIGPLSAQARIRDGRISGRRARQLAVLKKQGARDVEKRHQYEALVRRIQAERYSVNDARSSRWGKHLQLEGRTVPKQEMSESDDTPLPSECDGFLLGATEFLKESVLMTTHSNWFYLQNVKRQMGLRNLDFGLIGPEDDDVVNVSRPVVVEVD